jgi:uncharacterized protein
MAAPMAPPMAGGGSFLGTAAAAAAGAIGGSLLLDSIRSMMGHRGGAQAAFDPTGGASGASPWDGGAGGGELSRQAGLDDIGRGNASPDAGGGGRYGLLDDGTQADQDADDVDDSDFGFDDDSGQDV